MALVAPVAPVAAVAPAAPVAATITIISELDVLLRVPPAAPIAAVPIAQLANVALTADSSIFVPLKQKVGGYDADSLITISSLINQWFHWTGDTALPANYTDFGALSGIFQPGAGGQAALLDRAGTAILSLFGNNHQQACDFLEAAAAGQGGGGGGAAVNNYNTLRDYIWAMQSNPAVAAAGAAGVPVVNAVAANAVAFPGGQGMCWANILDAGYNHLAGLPELHAGEAYIPDVNNHGLPTPSIAPAAAAAGAAPAAPPHRLLPPSYLVRYAFGLLYRIKQILGEEGWTGAHWQIAFGGKKKSSRFTHRKKQYSQRRYKK